MEIDAPIVAGTVFADQARVTRRARLTLSAGELDLVLDRLPLSLRPDSIRVSGSGAVTVLGVDVALRHPPRSADEVVRGLEEQLREVRAAILAIEDEDAAASQRLEYLAELARRATRSFATALPAGETDPARIAELFDALDAQQAAVREQRRALARRRQDALDAAAAREREISQRRQAAPDHYAATVALAASADGEVVLEVSYVVSGAQWRSVYDVRLVGDQLTLSWFGLVSQRTGEDWPACELRLSTARPSIAAAVPELQPWFLDRSRPPAPQALSAAARARGGLDEVQAVAAAPALQDAFAIPEQGPTAATYRPQRMVAVPADGDFHRTTIAVIEFTAKRDYITAPLLAEEAHLRATAVNTSSHTLPAGTMAVFHGPDFVGSTTLEVWAPGEEIELALGIDDRVRVERKLARRSAAKAVLGSSRRRETEHRITVTNHTSGHATITVLDQLPVSRDDAISVKELRLDPAPAERTDLGMLTWVLEVSPGEAQHIDVGLRVETTRGVEIVGWRE